MKTYSIKDWSSLYENNRTRDMAVMRWVPVPNRHDGDGYTTLVDRKNGAAMLGCWLAILQVASKCNPRGTLLRDSGQPHTPDSISRITRIPAELIAECIIILVTECKWLDFNAPQEGAEKPQEGAGFPQATDYGREGNRIEKKGSIEQTNKGAIPILEEVKSFGGMRGIKAEDCERFWHHFESTGWIDKNGHPVAKWQSKLMTWKTQAQAQGGPATAVKRKPFISEIKTVLEAKKTQRERIFNRGTDSPLGWTARNQQDKDDYKQLNKEIAEMINQIAETEL